MKTNSKILIPLAVKLVFLTSLLVLSVSLTIAWKNSELFQQISTDREESTAEMITASKALEVEAILESYVEKLSSLAQDGQADKPLTGELVFYRLATSAEGMASNDISNAGADEELLKSYRHTLSQFEAYTAEIQQGKIFIASTADQLKEPMLIVGAPVAKENGFVSHWAWGLFRLNRLQASFEGSKNLKIYLVDGKGKVIVHPEEQKTLKASDLSGHKIVAQMLKEEIRKRQQYLDGTLYSSSKTVFGPLVIGEVTQASIIAPAKLAKETTIFILGIVLSLSFFLSVVFSHTLSRNLEKLMGFAHRIATGDFDVRAQDEIRSKDEIGMLAHAFDDMTEGLKERDKIKNMFTKFHGTSVTETLMNEEDLRKGRNCEAVVFFSDIRGFTDFSSTRTAEEVVAMLNSYFEVMVGIINRHGGVVDKFVGDAIMAVWGAPNSSPDDAKKAVMACLEMRKALAVFNEERIAGGQPPIMMGMGLHAGMVVSGTVGSSERLEYTVIGDTVNTASRIESATKSFGTDLLISEEVVKRVGDDFLTTFAGSTKVKGKSEPLKLAKVNGYLDANSNPCVVSTPYSQYEAEDSDKVKIVA